MADKKKITRRDALKRMGKLAAAASAASVVPIDAIGAVGGDRKNEEEVPFIAYNSFKKHTYP